MANIMPSQVGTLLASTPVPMLEAPEAATQTFVIGDFVYTNAGYLTICGVNPALIAGIAVEPAHNALAGAYKLGYAVAGPLTIFKLSVYHTVPANNVIEATDLFSDFGLTRSAAGKWVLDKTKTGGNARARVVKFVDALGTVAGRVGVIILAANRQVS